MKLLDSLLDKTLSMEEAAASAKEIKEMCVVKDAFVEEVGLKNWEEAVASVPAYTKQLKMFKDCKGKGAPFKVLYTDTPMHMYFVHNHQVLLSSLSAMHRYSE